MLKTLIVAVMLSASLAAVLVPVSMQLAGNLGLVDLRRHRRGEEEQVMPRGAGVAIMVAAAIVICGMAIFASGWYNAVTWWFVLGSFGFGLLGLIDDFQPQAPLMRLGAQAFIALSTCLAVLPAVLNGPQWISAVMAAFAVVVFVNVFNFMDGIDGISTVTAALIGGFLIVVGVHWDDHTSALLGAVAAGTALGFGPFNIPLAKSFLGDGGAYFFGAALSFGAVSAVDAGAPIVVVCIPAALYIADVFSTLLRRLMRGSSLLGRHREFAFHRLATGRLDHLGTTVLVAVITLGLVALAVAGIDRSPASQALVGGICMLLVGAYLCLPRFLRIAGQTQLDHDRLDRSDSYKSR